MKRSLNNCLWLALLGILSFGSAINTAAQANPTPSPDSRSASRPATNTPLIMFEPPTDEKVDNSRGGASRPTDVKCMHDESYGFPMTALVPQSGVGLTTSSHPTLMVYVPPTMATQAHLTLRDDKQNGLYQSPIQIPQTGGILRISLPMDSPELVVGQTYHWSLALLCQPTQTDLPITSGQIRRVDLSDAELPPQQPLLSQAVMYGQAGVWHDMLLSLALLKESQPESDALNENWIELLRSEDLGAIANTPLLN